jgi:hypothetical protein
LAIQKIIEEHQETLLEKWNEHLAVEVEPLAVDVSCTDDTLRVVLADGHEISVPLIWSMRLHKAAPSQRNEWRLIGGGIGIHWEAVDEDISVESLLRLK